MIRYAKLKRLTKGSGLRFSTKALMAFFWSSVSKQEPNSFSSTVTARSISTWRPSFTAFLQALTAIGALPAMRCAILRASSISCSAG